MDASGGLAEAFQQIADLFDRRAHRFNLRTNEAQTEADFIRPVLNLLWGNDCYQVQPRIPNVDVQRQPDFAFFRNASDREAAQSRLGTADYWRDLACLGDAKKWTASLDKERGADENPTAQICNYLYRSRVRWGILTNGRTWRLYEREKSSAGGIYYEVNLEELLRSGDLEAFKYFYLFFRREAFLPDASGATFLEKVYQGSVEYAAQVGDRLKESVYDALRLLMNGLFEHSSNGLDRSNSDTVKLVHENCLIVLYRLLFLLYAEDRKLLPRSTEPYANYSLYRLQKEINEHLRAGEAYLPMGHRFWNDLLNLFELIDKGFPEGGIPSYNGGLFSPSNHPHIAHTPQAGATRWEIGDHRIAQVIDMLAYQRERWNEPGELDIDYNTLDVQHLGSIYEGLLELQPQIATEPMTETLEDGKAVFKPSHEVPASRVIRGQPPRVVNTNEVYLITNRGERRASGSYYTPKCIVDYIVETTVGPLAEEASGKTKALLPEVSREVARLERGRREWARSTLPEAAEQIAGFDKLIDEQKRRLLLPYLSLQILDPAMGSGHFLVGTADFLSLAMATDPSILPLEDASNEDPQAFYKRLVVERCLYGVDLNTLAVELAKLSLWLHTVSHDKALSFLNHHLRCGNSLIGASVENDLSRIPPELDSAGRVERRDVAQLVFGFTDTLTATHLQYLLDTFHQIVELPTGDAEFERMKDTLYREMDAVRNRFRAVANCWLAPYFGVEVTPEQFQHAVTTLRGTEADLRLLAEESWFRDAQAVAEQERFFHWELEFPEAFFNSDGFKPRGERGFDAGIGNPPYGIVFRENEKALLEVRFPSFIRNNDLYVAFTEFTLRTCRAHRSASMIVPNTFILGPYFTDLRKLVRETVNTLFVADFGTTQVFDDPNVFNAIFLFAKGEGRTVPEERRAYFCRASLHENQVHLLDRVDVNVNELSDARWKIEHPIVLKMRTAGLLSLGDLTFVKDVGFNYWTVGRGKTRGGSIGSRVLYDGESRSSQDTPYLKGGDFTRYGPVESQRHWLRHDWENLLVPPADIFRFSPESLRVPKKIVYRQTSDRLIASIDTGGLLVDKTVHVVLLREDYGQYSYEYLLSILNSTLANFAYVDFAQEEGRTFAQVKTFNVKRIPIHRVLFTTSRAERARLLERGRHLYERCLSRTDYACVVESVEHELTRNGEGTDVAHDLLAMLAGQMIEMNTEKRAEVVGFLTWLERCLGARIEDLSNKTRLHAYHDYDFNTLLAILRQNRRKLRIPDSRSQQTAIETEFSESNARLAPLTARMAITDRLIDLIVYRLYGLGVVSNPTLREDRLIDLIVYRLYGLTDEEIAIVDRGTSSGAGGDSPVEME